MAADEVPEMRPARPHHWTFLSNHAHVLVCLARNPDVRLREVAAAVGITERAVQGIVGDLEQGGVISRQRAGRRNRYLLKLDAPLRHPLEAHCSIRSLLAMVLGESELARLSASSQPWRKPGAVTCD